MIQIPDERFFTHRLKSTSIAGVCGGLVAVGLWAYRYYINDVFSWDLFAVAVTVRGSNSQRWPGTGSRIERK